MSNNKQTLFSRYKNMINELWNLGMRKYTAAELNKFVGDYENSTPWKGAENRYYTTRMYQTALKHLGCVTKLERGLWQINGPVPEWFGSFHIKALTSKYALKDLENYSVYWMNLEDEHKVNPWKTTPVNTIENNELNKTNNMNTNTNTTVSTPLNIFTEVTLRNIDFNVVGPMPISFNTDISITYSVCAFLNKDGSVGVDLCDKWWSDTPATNFIEAFKLLVGNEKYHKLLESLDERAKKEVASSETIKASLSASSEPTKVVKEGLYTKEQVLDILKRFVEGATRELRSTVEDDVDSLDADNLVEIDFDRYDRRLNVNLDTYAISREIGNSIADRLDTCYDEFEIDNESIDNEATN
jgi:hypothetical protein